MNAKSSKFGAQLECSDKLEREEKKKGQKKHEEETQKMMANSYVT